MLAHTSLSFYCGYYLCFDFYNRQRNQKIIALNIQEFISYLPQSIVNSEDISIPDDVIRKLFRLADLCKDDIFFDLRCGNSNAVKLAAKEFKVKRSVGIEIRKTLAKKARKKIIRMKNIEIINENVS